MRRPRRTRCWQRAGRRGAARPAVARACACHGTWLIGYSRRAGTACRALTGAAPQLQAPAAVQPRACDARRRAHQAAPPALLPEGPSRPTRRSCSLPRAGGSSSRTCSAPRRWRTSGRPRCVTPALPGLLQTARRAQQAQQRLPDPASLQQLARRMALRPGCLPAELVAAPACSRPHAHQAGLGSSAGCGACACSSRSRP